MAVICGEVFLGVKTFYPELSEQKADVIDQVISEKAKITDKLSAEQLEFIKNKPRAIVGTDPNFYPLETFDERGQYSGLGSDYLKLINHMTGLELYATRDKDWATAEQKAQEGLIDVFLAVAKTDRRQEYLNFTPAYIHLPGMIVVRRGQELKNLDVNALKGKKVAVVENYFWHDYLVANNPEIELVLAPNTISALHLVANNSADAVVDYAFNLNEKMQIGGFLQMETAGEVVSAQGHSVAVRKELAPLLGIINIALENITAEEHQTLAEKWLDRPQPTTAEKQMQWYLFFFTQAFIVCIGVVTYGRACAEKALTAKSKQTAMLD